VTVHAVKIKLGFALIALLVIGPLLVLESIGGGYKAPIWTMGARESYPASLTSEGVTIAVDPLYTDALAAQVFDKEDMVTRGIMPFAVLIFNDNDFPIEVHGSSVELICEEDHIRTMYPYEVVYRLFTKSKEWIKQPIPKSSRSVLNKNALDDFEHKFLLYKTIPGHDKGAGFLYMHIPQSEDPAAYLSKALIYIPRVFRQDDGSRLIFFEIELKAALKSIPPKG
jgi:hypothetical protein